MRLLVGCALGAALLAGASAAQTEAELAQAVAVEYDRAISEDETLATQAVTQFFADRACTFSVADFGSGAEIGTAMLDSLTEIAGLDPLPSPARLEFASAPAESEYAMAYDDVFTLLDVATENLFAAGAIVEGPEAGVYTMVEGCP